ncbi:MAG: hypothetical protein EOP53_23625, partial [Sphingobacteriales bacterium]
GLELGTITAFNDLQLQFLIRSNHADLQILRGTKEAVRVSICHTATVIANGFMHSGTTSDQFLRDNLEWLARATNWAKLTATASLGVIHRGHENESLALMQSYLPKESGPSSGYSEGGGLYALGLIHANHGANIIEYLMAQLKEAQNENVRHGGCLGLGLAAMGTHRSDIYEQLKFNLYQDDAVTRAILSGNEKPLNIFDVREKLEKKWSGKLKTHIVANRGHDNPKEGSFSFFETYIGPMQGGTVQEGELFIGFFSETQGNNLAVQQSFEPGLMIELIAWDYTKKMYNFWELVGNGKSSEWHFRGDTQDILVDTAKVNMGITNAPVFNNPRLRCSACHTTGTPILKELDKPNNDWWTTAAKLKMGNLKLQPGSDPQNAIQVAGKLFQNATDVSNLSFQVKKGIDRLIASHTQNSLSLKQKLRPLFSTMEMNLASDNQPFEKSISGKINITSEFFVDSRLSGIKKSVPVNADIY